MQHKFNFNGLVAYWRLRQMKRLARSTATPKESDVDEMLQLLGLTDKRADGWPIKWSPDWYRALAKSDSWNGNNLCCTTPLDDFTQDFIHEMALYGLKANNIPLFEWFVHRLDARTVPAEMWTLLLVADPIIQLRFLVKLPNLPALEGNDREPGLTMLAKSEPYFWMYDYADWYTALAEKWNIVPPTHWWNRLYTMDLHRPPKLSRSLAQHYRGHTVNQVFQIEGRTTYSESHLLRHRSAILSQDPWAIVRSAFYGDTQMWPPRPIHDKSALVMYVDAYAIFMEYYPHVLQTDFHNHVPDCVRNAPPRVEFMMFFGMPSGEEAAVAFSAWLAANNGQLTCVKPPENFSLDSLLYSSETELALVT